MTRIDTSKAAYQEWQQRLRYTHFAVQEALSQYRHSGGASAAIKERAYTHLYMARRARKQELPSYEGWPHIFP